MAFSYHQIRVVRFRVSQIWMEKLVIKFRQRLFLWLEYQIFFQFIWIIETGLLTKSLWDAAKCLESLFRAKQNFLHIYFERKYRNVNLKYGLSWQKKNLLSKHLHSLIKLIYHQTLSKKKVKMLLFKWFYCSKDFWKIFKAFLDWNPSWSGDRFYRENLFNTSLK